MSTIIAGNFPSKVLADEAVGRLRRMGIDREAIHCISLNPPGQHDLESPSFAKSDTPSQFNEVPAPPHAGAAGAATGAAIGGAVGLGIGVATTPIAGPTGMIAGTGVGAYVGSLIGALGGLEGNANEPEIRHAGVLVAVRVDDMPAAQQIKRVLQEANTRQLEVADGLWQNGQWIDFDPESEPMVISVATTTDAHR